MRRVLAGFPMFVWALLGILGVSAALLSLGSRDDEAHPAADSYGPSGTSVLAELLRARGYAVRIDRWPHPRLHPGDVAIACIVPHVASAALTGGESDDFSAYLNESVRRGADAIELPISRNFLTRSRELYKAQPVRVVPRGDPKPLMIDLGKPGEPSNVAEDSPAVGLWDFGDVTVLRAYQVGNGRILQTGDGDFVTNRFIDRHDNARAILDMVSMLAPPGGSVVFTGAAYGDVNPPGLFETIGPWAIAGWWQFLLLGGVVIYTLGKPFGIPDERRRTQRGARELLDALADTYTRGRQTKAAMETALERMEVQIRTALRAPRDATFAELTRRLPDPLVNALRDLRTAGGAESPPAPAEALGYVARARQETDLFLGRRVQPSKEPVTVPAELP